MEQCILWIHEQLGLKYIPGFTGVEWWVHKRKVGEEYMRFHFDKDEGEWASNAKMKHPVISSVFYITQAGGATLIVSQEANPTMTRLLPARPLGGFESSPRENSLLVFPGSLLHGVLPATNIPVLKDGKIQWMCPEFLGEWRVTLLMNWWDSPLNDESCRQLRDADAKTTGNSLSMTARYGRCVHSDM